MKPIAVEPSAMCPPARARSLLRLAGKKQGWRLHDVRRIALALPETSEGESGFAFGVMNRGKSKGLAWVWQERPAPKKPRVPNPEVIALRVADESEKVILLTADAEKFFTEDHYNGFPAILVRLPTIDAEELAELITDAWRCQAPSALVTAFDARDKSDPSSVSPA